MASKLNELHAKYYEKLLRTARKLCQGAKWMDPTELVQEALLRLIERFGDSPDDTAARPLIGWLIAVMARYSFDQRRRLKSSQEAKDDPTLTQWTLGQGDGSPTYESITPERFDWAIQKLPEQQRRTFLLRADGLRNQEIARKLGLSVNTVAKRLFDARKKLRELLQPYVGEGIH